MSAVVRAYTYVDSGTARAGNRWLERSWSAFLGHTVELQYPRGEFEWCDRTSPEFEFQSEGRTLGYMDFGTVEWSEECDRFGATLVARHLGETLELVSRTTFFHSQPGYLRRWVLIQRGGEPVALDAIHLDLLNLRRDNVMVDAGETVTVAKTFGKTLIYGVTPVSDGPPRDAWQLGSQHGAGVSLHPGHWLRLPESCMLCAAGNIEQALHRDWGQFLDHVHQYKQAEEEALRLRMEPQEE